MAGTAGHLQLEQIQLELLQSLRRLGPMHGAAACGLVCA